jgi:hypothetical protein
MVQEITGLVQLRAEAEAADLLLDDWDMDEDEEIEEVTAGVEGLGVEEAT